ncbi:MAG TPA: LysR family transcriptional regulator [Gallicola sp.]|nr:LysR family transcriptional regulator [Gallicola sp.]
MNIRHLKIFKTVCEEESITKASEKLFITQPAVSNAINDLETYLGIYLFDRISRKIQLNETGKIFLAKTIKLLDLYDDLEQNAKEILGNAMIKIGSSITIATFILPVAIAEFEINFKNVPTRVVVDNASKIEKMVVNNEVDLGLIEGVVTNDNLENIPFSSYELLVICSSNHPFAKEKIIGINKLIKEKLLLREKGSAIRDVFDSALLLNGISVNPTWISVNSNVLVQAVKSNLGVSILPREKVEKELKDGEIAEVKVKGLELVSTNHIIYHKEKYQTYNMKKFIEIIQNVSPES